MSDILIFAPGVSDHRVEHRFFPLTPVKSISPETGKETTVVAEAPIKELISADDTIVFRTDTSGGTGIEEVKIALRQLRSVKHTGPVYLTMSPGNNDPVIDGYDVARISRPENAPAHIPDESKLEFYKITPQVSY